MISFLVNFKILVCPGLISILYVKSPQVQSTVQYTAVRHIGRYSSKNRDEFLVVSERLRLRCYLVLQYNETGLRAKFGRTQKLASDLHIN